MQSTITRQPNIHIKGDEVIISFPTSLLLPKKVNGVPAAPARPTPDFTKFIGMFKHVPAFKDKTSVEVQHMMSILWTKTPKAYS